MSAALPLGPPAAKSSTASIGGARWRALVPILIIAAVAIASRAVWFGDPAPDSDEQIYSLIGARMLGGALPYIDLFDRKPFGLFALYAIAHAIGGPGPLAYQLLATGFIAAGGYLTYLLALQLCDRVTALGAGVLYPLLMYAYGSLSGQSEAFFVPLLLGALLQVQRIARDEAGRRAVWAMLLAGTALQIKYSVLPQCLFLGGVALWHFRDCGLPQLAGKAAIFALAGLTPTLAVALFYAIQDGLDAFFYANFLSVFERTPAQSGRFAAEHVAPLLPLAALALAGTYLTLRDGNPPPGYRLLMGWSVAVLAGIYMLSTVYLYYFAAFVPAAILLALPMLSVRNALRWVPLAFVTAAAISLLNLPLHLSATRQTCADLERMTTIVRPLLSENLCLFVFHGPAALYRMTGSCLPSRIVYPDHFNNPLERFALGVRQEREVARILAASPPVIVVRHAPAEMRNSPAQRLVGDALLARYRVVAVARIRGESFEAWALRDGARPSRHSLNDFDRLI